MELPKWREASSRKAGAAEMLAHNDWSNTCEELSRHLLLSAEINSWKGLWFGENTTHEKYLGAKGEERTARITLGAANDRLMQTPKEINLSSNLVCVKIQWIMFCDQYFYCYCTESCLHLGTLEGFWAAEASKCALEQNWTSPQKAGRKRRGSRELFGLQVLLEWVWSDKD